MKTGQLKKYSLSLFAPLWLLSAAAFAQVVPLVEVGADSIDAGQSATIALTFNATGNEVNFDFRFTFDDTQFTATPSCVTTLPAGSGNAGITCSVSGNTVSVLAIPFVTFPIPPIIEGAHSLGSISFQSMVNTPGAVFLLPVTEEHFTDPDGATTAHCGRSSATDLFISEYIEGSSFNKAIEIYNGTDSAVDLATGLYTLELYTNGSAVVSQFVALSGTIASGDVYVIAHTSADAAILAIADATSGSVINFNGNDAVVLRKDGAVVDAFGQVGVDPGSQWVGGGQNDTLRRADSVCAGDTNSGDAFDASVEWIFFAQNTFDGLGSHTAKEPTSSIDGEIIVTPIPIFIDGFEDIIE